MLVRIEREICQYPDATVGVLLVDGKPICYTREDPLRVDQVFVPGEAALPRGLYNVTFSRSRRFGLETPLVVSTFQPAERRRQSVRVGMRFHPGAPEVDLGGEILLGMAREGSTVHRTGEAFRLFSSIIRAAVDRHEAVDLEIF